MATVTNLDTATVNKVLNKNAWRQARTSLASFQRPNDTTAYTAGDVISNSSTVAAVLEFPGCASRNGGGGIILGGHIVHDQLNAGSFGFELFLFDTEPTNLKDNVAFALGDDELPVAMLLFDAAGRKNLNSTASPAGVQYWHTAHDEGALPIRTQWPYVCGASSTSLYGILTTPEGFTPIAQSKLMIRLSLEVDL